MLPLSERESTSIGDAVEGASAAKVDKSIRIAFRLNNASALFIAGPFFLGIHVIVTGFV